MAVPALSPKNAQDLEQLIEDVTPMPVRDIVDALRGAVGEEVCPARQPGCA